MRTPVGLDCGRQAESWTLAIKAFRFRNPTRFGGQTLNACHSTPATVGSVLLTKAGLHTGYGPAGEWMGHVGQQEGLRRKITIKVKCPACLANHILAGVIRNACAIGGLAWRKLAATARQVASNGRFPANSRMTGAGQLPPVVAAAEQPLERRLRSETCRMAYASRSANPDGRQSHELTVMAHRWAAPNSALA